MLLITVFLAIIVNTSCNNTANSGSKTSANPITVVEYDYITKEYFKNATVPIGKDMVKTEVFTKTINTKVAGEPALFGFTAYDVKRNENEAPFALIIKYDMDYTKNSPFGGQPRKLQETKYFCLPSAKASETMHTKFQEEVAKMPYKDYEVFMSSLSQLLAELYL